MKLSKEELNKIEGGAIFKTSSLIIGGIFTFILGVIDGFLRPLKCN